MGGLADISTEELLRMRNTPAGAVDLSKMSTEDLMKMRTAPEKPSVVADIVKSIPGAVPRAASALVGFPQTVMGLIQGGLGYGMEKVGMIPPGTRELAKSELTNVGDIATEGYDKISDLLTGKPVYRPQTGPGRIADTTVQTMISGPGSMAQKAIIGGAAGISGEGARRITDNPIAIGVIQMLGGGLASLPFILRSIPAKNIDDAIRNIKPEDLTKAQALMDDAAKMGTPITGAEAIAQVTGKNTLQDIQRVVESSRQGAPVMQPTMNARPSTARAAFESQADTIAAMPAEQARTPVKMQQAAEEALKKARQAGNAEARPYYQAADQQAIPPNTWNSLTQEPAAQKALATVRGLTEYGVTGEKEGSIRWLDAAKKWLDAKIQSQNTPPSEKMIWEQGRTAIVDAADMSSSQYRSARATVAKNMRDVVSPMRESPVGDISGTKGLPAEAAMRQQAEILMPQAPRALDPPTIHRTVETLSKQNPEAAKNFVRQNLQAVFDEAAQNLSGGTNQWGGAKFAAQIAGNPRQKDNLQALVESVSDRKTWNGFNRMLEVMEAQGKRNAPGSQTAQNLMVESELAKGGYGSSLALIPSPGRMASFVYDWYQAFRFGKNSDQMARILTDPKSVDLMRQLAKEAPTSAKATALTAQIVASQAAETGDVQNSTNR